YLVALAPFPPRCWPRRARRRVGREPFALLTTTDENPDFRFSPIAGLHGRLLWQAQAPHAAVRVACASIALHPAAVARCGCQDVGPGSARDLAAAAQRTRRHGFHGLQPAARLLGGPDPVRARRSCRAETSRQAAYLRSREPDGADN